MNRIFYATVGILIMVVSSLSYGQSVVKTGFQIFHFTDATRNKKIAVSVWYPAPNLSQTTLPKGVWQQDPIAYNAPMDLKVSTAQHEKLPLVILSHGYRGTPDSLSWFAVNLARHGFIVAAPQHNDGGDQNKPYMEHWQRAVDDSFVLKELKNSVLAKNIDFSRVGMAGYSVGTSTGLWLAGAIASTYERTASPGRQFVPEEEFPDADSDIAKNLLKNTDFKAAKASYREPLIKAVFLIAPGYAWAFDVKHLAKISIPIFIVAAENDEMLYPETNAYYFSKYIPNSEMKIIPDAGHFIFLNRKKDLNTPNLTAAEKNQIEFLSHLGKFTYSDQQQDAVQEEVGNLAVKFFAANLQ